MTRRKALLQKRKAHAPTQIGRSGWREPKIPPVYSYGEEKSEQKTARIFKHINMHLNRVCFHQGAYYYNASFKVSNPNLTKADSLLLRKKRRK